MSSVFLRIDVESEDVFTRRFKDRNGNERSFAEQEVVVWVCSKGSEVFEPKRIKVPLEKGMPYTKGKYTLDPKSFFVDYKNYGRLALVPRLLPDGARYFQVGERVADSRYTPDGYPMDLES